MKVLLHPVYFPNVEHLTAMVQSDDIIFEANDTFQKQTYRNRAFIYGANGLLQLNIPVKHSQNNRQLYRDVKISYDTNWQQIHKRSIESAYRTSPFFEFYEDEILPVYDKKHVFIFDLNLRTIEIIFGCLQLQNHYSLSETFHTHYKDIKDLRYLVEAKRRKEHLFEDYSQVFNVKHGFINNLSCMDLLCNLGPNTTDYLRTINLF